MSKCPFQVDLLGPSGMKWVWAFFRRSNLIQSDNVKWFSRWSWCNWWETQWLITWTVHWAGVEMKNRAEKSDFLLPQLLHPASNLEKQYLIFWTLLFWHIVTLPPEAELQRSNIAMKTCCDEKIFQSHFSSEISMNWPSSNRLFRRARIKDSLLNVFDMPGFSSLHCCNGNSRNACIWPLLDTIKPARMPELWWAWVSTSDPCGYPACTDKNGPHLQGIAQSTTINWSHLSWRIWLSLFDVIEKRIANESDNSRIQDLPASRTSTQK